MRSGKPAGAIAWSHVITIVSTVDVGTIYSTSNTAQSAVGHGSK